MFKSIKVTEEVLKLIQRYQCPRESYSHVLERAFDAWETIDRIKRGEYPPPVRPERPKEEGK